MGIRVDGNAMLKQLKIRGLEERKELMWHQMLLDGKLPLSLVVGSDSRGCVCISLRKAHIGEIQSSLWPDEMIQKCKSSGIHLL
jgi:aspartate--ammonia ligase